MARGLLTQAAATAGAERGRPAGIVLRVHGHGRITELRSRAMRAVATADLLARLRQIVGEPNVRIRTGDWSYLLQRNNRRQFPQRAQETVGV